MVGRPLPSRRDRTSRAAGIYEYAQTPLAQTLENLVVAAHKAPVYVVHFTQAATAESAQNFHQLERLQPGGENPPSPTRSPGFASASPYGPEIKRWLRHGIGLHHAGLLPKYRVLVEGLAQRGLLKVICGTDTLGVGINVPDSDRALHPALQVRRAERRAYYTARDFHQIGGRAGRKGYDDAGHVVAQAPEHVIENLQSWSRRPWARKFVRRKPPEKGLRRVGSRRLSPA